jgi:hypothetical protein
MTKIERLRPLDWARLKRLRIAALIDSPDAFGATLASARARSPQQWREQVQSLPHIREHRLALDL